MPPQSTPVSSPSTTWLEQLVQTLSPSPDLGAADADVADDIDAVDVADAVADGADLASGADLTV